jgi:hypothetical protein
MTLKEIRTGIRVIWWVAKLNGELWLYDLDDWLAANIYPFWGRARALPRGDIGG